MRPQRNAAATRTTSCAANKPGETADKVLGRLKQELDQATAFQRSEGVSVVYGQDSQFVCDIRFSGGQVAVAAVVPLE